jgi:hypothetical protein
VERFLGDVERGDAHFAVGAIFLAEEAAIGGDVLVLFADRLLQKIKLNMACLFGQCLGRDVFSFIRVDGFEKPYVERS